MNSLSPILLAVIVAFCSFTNSALAGKEVGNGGDAIAADFKSLGADVVSVIGPNKSVASGSTSISMSALSQALEKAAIETTEEALILDGVRKDAINYPASSRIVIDLIRWREMLDTDRRHLVVHELLGLMGVDDTHYFVSLAIINAFNRTLKSNASGVPKCTYRAHDSKSLAERPLIYLSSSINMSSPQLGSWLGRLEDGATFTIMEHMTQITLTGSQGTATIQAFKARLLDSKSNRLAPGTVFWSSGESTGGRFECE